MSIENETRKHQQEVAKQLTTICQHLLERATTHDLSKLESPEAEMFEVYTPKLAGCTYGSDEYKQYLSELKPALDHHYANNRHHPEHKGIENMTLIDIIEMFCDWYAATKRHNDGDIMKSITINEPRFGINPQLSNIFRNTVKLMKISDIFYKHVASKSRFNDAEQLDTKPIGDKEVENK